MPPGRRLLRKALLPTAEAIRRFLEAANAGRAGRKHTAAPLLAGAEPEALAYLTLRCAIQSGVLSERHQPACLRIARAVQDHLRTSQFEEVAPKVAKAVQRSMDRRTRISSKRLGAVTRLQEQHGVRLTWPLDVQLQVGSKLLELADEATGLFEIALVEEGRGRSTRRRYEVRLTQKVEEWLEAQHARCELLDPLPLPMVVPPVPWTNLEDGGYLEPPIGNRAVRTDNRAYLEELANMDLAPVFEALNAIQMVPWRINRRILAVMQQAWQSGGQLGGLPPGDGARLPPKPDNFEQDEAARSAWKAAAAEVHAANAHLRGKRMGLMQRLWVAEKLRDFPAIYFPHNLDFRGRVYPIPAGGPHPQDTDPGRALLEFADGLPLGEEGARWLAIHIANLFGVDKVPFEERVEWVARNEAAILDSARDPLDGHRFWTTADKPWQALAACFEWADYRRDGGEASSRLPVALDGSCSGLQHFTALLRDADASPYVNLVPQDRPSDLYSFVAAQAQRLVDASDEPSAACWKNGRVTRRIVKRPCMTYAYSATRLGMAQQIETALNQLDAEARSRGLPPHVGGADNRQAAMWLAAKIYSLIGETVPAAQAGRDWLQQVAAVISKAGVPIWWTTPAGLPVMQHYVEPARNRVTVTYRGRKLQLLLEDHAVERLSMFDCDTEPMSVLRSAAVRGIAPNYIHSLDAAHLMRVVQRCRSEGIAHLALIHDSFGTHPAHSRTLSRILREEFVALYQEDPLFSFWSEVRQQLADQPELMEELTPPPALGTLNLQEIAGSNYMFA